MEFICYSRCSTCKKANEWLSEKNIEFSYREIKTQNPTREELVSWHKISGLPLKRFFNTSGLLYKELGLSTKLKTMSEDEQYDLLSTDGMLVKRPLLVDDKFVLVGFKVEEWEEKFKEN